ncbi:hypothetical protein [Bradyrhizobium iriomotense]|nr:hypothetical protein [Bradyrhizobium iriomotense]MBR1130811.1 hypothetical protein [Bradyrhizobium iriomotense]
MTDLCAIAVYRRSVPPRFSDAGARIDPTRPALAASTLYSPPPAEARGGI